MRIVDLKLQKIQVTNFSAKDDSVVLELSFDDGAVKQVYRHTTIDEPKQVTDSVFAELVRMEKNINVEFDGKELAGAVKVVIANEAEDKHRMSVFFSDLKNRIFRVKSSKISDGYLDLIRDVNKMKLEL